MSTVDDPDFWESHYRAEEQRWELGGPAPPISSWLALRRFVAGERAVVPGCGRGHEVIALAEQGLETVGIDFAPSAIAAGRAAAARAPLRAPATFIEEDLFLAGRRPDLAGTFDLAVEHTSYCAIDPARRDEYAAVLAALLRPGGRLVGLFYAHGREGGPPYTTSAEDVRARFAPAFEIQRLAVAEDSIPRRRGLELFAEMIRR